MKAKEKEQVVILSPLSRIENIVTGRTALAVILIVSTVAFLTLVKTNAARLGLVGVFTILIASLLASSRARKTEVTIGTIGYSDSNIEVRNKKLIPNRYAAVLVVFVSNQST